MRHLFRKSIASLRMGKVQELQQTREYRENRMKREILKANRRVRKWRLWAEKVLKEHSVRRKKLELRRSFETLRDVTTRIKLA